MANINKNALISITRGNATGFSRINFNIPEEMKFTFPLSDLFKMDLIGFNVEKIEFKEEPNRSLIIMHSTIAKTKLLNAIFTFSVHKELFNSLKLLLSNEESSQIDNENSLSLIKKVIESCPPIIQIVPKLNLQ